MSSHHHHSRKSGGGGGGHTKTSKAQQQQQHGATNTVPVPAPLVAGAPVPSPGGGASAQSKQFSAYLPEDVNAVIQNMGDVAAGTENENEVVGQGQVQAQAQAQAQGQAQGQQGTIAPPSAIDARHDALATSAPLSTPNNNASSSRHPHLQHHPLPQHQPPKRSRNNELSLEQKLEVIQAIDSGLSYRSIAPKFGISTGTVGRINQDKEDIRARASRIAQAAAAATTAAAAAAGGNSRGMGLQSAQRNEGSGNAGMQTPGQDPASSTTPLNPATQQQQQMFSDPVVAEFYRSTKRLKGEAAELDRRLIFWYLTNREHGNLVTGTQLQERALMIAQEMGLGDFKASNGWLEKFQRRHGINKYGGMDSSHVTVQTTYVGQQHGGFPVGALDFGSASHEVPQPRDPVSAANVAAITAATAANAHQQQLAQPADGRTNRSKRPRQMPAAAQYEYNIVDDEMFMADGLSPLHPGEQDGIVMNPPVVSGKKPDGSEATASGQRAAMGELSKDKEGPGSSTAQDMDKPAATSASVQFEAIHPSDIPASDAHQAASTGGAAGVGGGVAVATPAPVMSPEETTLAAESLIHSSPVSALLPALLAGYTPSNIFTVAQIGLLYRIVPSQMFMEMESQLTQGGKLYKERVTMLLTASATGEKLKPLVIWKSEAPRSFKPKNPDWILYRYNPKSWMAQNIFQDYVRWLNGEMKKQKRNIVLLLDEGTSNYKIKMEDCSNVKIISLPLLEKVIAISHGMMSTALGHLQMPFEVGITKAFKERYRRYVMTFLVTQDGLGSYGYDQHYIDRLSIFHTIRMIRAAWDDTPEHTISHAFRYALGLNVPSIAASRGVVATPSGAAAVSSMKAAPPGPDEYEAPDVDVSNVGPSDSAAAVFAAVSKMSVNDTPWVDPKLVAQSSLLPELDVLNQILRIDDISVDEGAISMSLCSDISFFYRLCVSVTSALGRSYPAGTDFAAVDANEFNENVRNTMNHIVESTYMPDPNPRTLIESYGDDDADVDFVEEAPSYLEVLAACYMMVKWINSNRGGITSNNGINRVMLNAVSEMQKRVVAQAISEHRE